MSFTDFGLSAELLRTLDEQHLTQPTPIQEEAIPVALAGSDLMGAAQTGTGKTAAFALPLLERLRDGKPARPLRARALILTPTRELAAQVRTHIATLGKHSPVRSTAVFGGVKINPQIKALQGGVDILVATPGRLLDLHQQNAVRFDGLETLVLDEADRMLDMGFIHDIKKILALLPSQRQTMMFSATFSVSIRKLARGILHEPREINVAPNVSTVETVKHKLHPVDKERKKDLLKHLIVEQRWHKALVFSRTKHGANKLVSVLEKARIPAAAIHGNRSQNQRTRALDGFKKGKVQILVATDIAARGIDIEQLPQVVNFDLPNVAEDYVHRIGRTGRAGAEGRAISLVSADEGKQLRDIERFIKQSVEREVIEGFEPTQPIGSQPATAPPRQRNGKQQHKRRRPRQKANANSTKRMQPQRRGQRKAARQSTG